MLSEIYKKIRKVVQPLSQIQYFTNDNFRTLAYLYDVKNGNNKAHITQHVPFNERYIGIKS